VVLFFLYITRLVCSDISYLLNFSSGPAETCLCPIVPKIPNLCLTSWSLLNLILGYIYGPSFAHIAQFYFLLHFLTTVGILHYEIGGNRAGRVRVCVRLIKKIIGSRVGFGSIWSGLGRTLLGFFEFRVIFGSGLVGFRVLSSSSHFGSGQVSDHLISDNLGIQVILGRVGFFFMMFYFGSGRVGFRVVRLNFFFFRNSF
jgi:hypothetical protein